MAQLFRIGLMFGHDFNVNLAFRSTGFAACPEVDYSGPEEVYYAPILRAIINAYRDESVQLKVVNTDPGGYFDAYRREKLDGMLILTASLDELPILRQLVEASVRFIAVGVSGSSSSDSDIPCVDCANRQGGHMAAEHLLTLGHRSFGCVNLANYYINHSDRMQGFMERVAAADCQISQDCLLTNPGYEQMLFNAYAYGWIERLVKAHKMPTALFACDFNMAEATVGALHDHGLSIPKDVSIVGFDDPAWTEHMTPPLTTVRQPVVEMGTRSAQRLLAALKNPDTHRIAEGTEILPTRLIARASTCRVAETASRANARRAA